MLTQPYLNLTLLIWEKTKAVTGQSRVLIWYENAKKALN